MIVNRHRQHALRARLPNDILIQYVIDFFRYWELFFCFYRNTFLNFFADNVVAEIYALVANEHRWASNELTNFVLALATERAIQQLAAIVPCRVFSCHALNPTTSPLHSNDDMFLRLMQDDRSTH